VSAATERQIITLAAGGPAIQEQAARLLVDGFTQMAPEAWPTLAAGREEVHTALESGKIALGMVDGAGVLLGWVGAMPQYDGQAWELHPLVVHPEYRRQHIGRGLVQALETQVRARGAVTIYLGTDDAMGMTSLSGANLYPDVVRHIHQIRNLGGHPYEFYQQLGYVIVGVIPDANGLGRPDILMAKRLAQA
jgi:aminoglycoside 6'-N-acetyltransferase I